MIIIRYRKNGFPIFLPGLEQNKTQLLPPAMSPWEGQSEEQVAVLCCKGAGINTSRRDAALLDHIFGGKRSCYGCILSSLLPFHCHKNLMRNVLRHTGQNKQLIIRDKQENNPTHLQTICVFE